MILCTGPYTKRGEAVSRWCHNPSAIRDKDGEFLLFHIGPGNETSTAAGRGFMHHSPSPYGPWMAAPTAIKCNNPAPAFHPNGTLFVVCNHLDLTYTATSKGWKGEWAPLSRLKPNFTDKDRNWEDPFLWFDRYGNWHIMYHVYCLKPYSAHKECMSGTQL